MDNPTPMDLELEAMHIIAVTLTGLPADSRRRILQWATDAFGSVSPPSNIGEQRAAEADNETLKIVEQLGAVREVDLVKELDITASGARQRLYAATKRGALRRAAPGVYTLPVVSVDGPTSTLEQLADALAALDMTKKKALEVAERTIRKHPNGHQVEELVGLALNHKED